MYKVHFFITKMYLRLGTCNVGTLTSKNSNLKLGEMWILVVCKKHSRKERIQRVLLIDI